MRRERLIGLISAVVLCAAVESVFFVGIGPTEISFMQIAKRIEIHDFPKYVDQTLSGFDLVNIVLRNGHIGIDREDIFLGRKQDVDVSLGKGSTWFTGDGFGKYIHVRNNLTRHIDSHTTGSQGCWSFSAVVYCDFSRQRLSWFQCFQHKAFGPNPCTLFQSELSNSSVQGRTAERLVQLHSLLGLMKRSIHRAREPINVSDSLPCLIRSHGATVATAITNVQSTVNLLGRETFLHRAGNPCG